MDDLAVLRVRVCPPGQEAQSGKSEHLNPSIVYRFNVFNFNLRVSKRFIPLLIHLS